MAVRHVLRENATLAIGVALPVVVVVFFLLATYIPRYFVAPPQYDFLFTSDDGYRAQPSGWRHEVDVDPQGRLRVRAFPVKEDVYLPRTRLFLYEHASGNVREIPLPWPETGAEAESGVEVAVPALEGAVIDTHRVAPDGYELVEPRSGGDFLGLFYRGNRRGLAIGKSGALFEVRASNDSRHYGSRFLGWVVSPPVQ